jgi:hypothetical protein
MMGLIDDSTVTQILSGFSPSYVGRQNLTVRMHMTPADQETGSGPHRDFQQRASTRIPVR